MEVVYTTSRKRKSSFSEHSYVFNTFISSVDRSIQIGLFANSALIKDGPVLDYLVDADMSTYSSSEALKSLLG